MTAEATALPSRSLTDRTSSIHSPSPSSSSVSSDAPAAPDLEAGLHSSDPTAPGAHTGNSSSNSEDNSATEQPHEINISSRGPVLELSPRGVRARPGVMRGPFVPRHAMRASSAEQYLHQLEHQAAQLLLPVPGPPPATGPSLELQARNDDENEGDTAALLGPRQPSPEPTAERAALRGVLRKQVRISAEGLDTTDTTSPAASSADLSAGLDRGQNQNQIRRTVSWPDMVAAASRPLAEVRPVERWLRRARLEQDTESEFPLCTSPRMLNIVIAVFVSVLAALVGFSLYLFFSRVVAGSK